MEARSNDWWRRAARTLLQLIASGALLALTDQLANDLPAAYQPYLLIAYTVIVSAAQNALEDAGAIPSVLKGKASSGANPVPDGMP